MIEYTFDGSDIRPAIEFLLKADLESNKNYTITIKEYRQRRSLSANAYFWLFLDKLAVKLNIGKDELYRQLIQDIGGVSDVFLMTDEAAARFAETWKERGRGWFCDTELSRRYQGATEVTAYYGSSVYDKAQMARLIDRLIWECNMVGIDTTDLKTKALLEVQDG